MARRSFELSHEELPSAKLKTLWCALDTDQSGFITAGEFGAFMKRGAQQVLTPIPSWKERLHAERREGAAALQAELKKEKLLMVDVSPADDAAVRNLSMLLHEAMAEMEPDPNKRTWYTLFKHCLLYTSPSPRDS